MLNATLDSTLYPLLCFALHVLLGNTVPSALAPAWFVNRGCSNRIQPKPRATTAMLGVLPKLPAASAALHALQGNLLLELAQ